MWVIVIAIATIVSLVGFRLQSNAIRRLQSGKSLSVPWIASLMIGALTKVIYGSAQLDTPLAINSIFTIVGQAVVFFPLVKYKKLKN